MLCSTLPLVALHPGIKIGIGDILVAVTLQWTSIPSRGGSSNTRCYFMVQNRGEDPAVWATQARTSLLKLSTVYPLIEAGGLLVINDLPADWNSVICG